MRKTNFDLFLEEQLRDPDFAERFKRAGEAWDVALQVAALREKAGLSQKELARKLKTTQQQISRLESPSYEGHSLSMLRRVARVLNAHVRVILESNQRGFQQPRSRATVTISNEAPGEKERMTFDCKRLLKINSTATRPHPACTNSSSRVREAFYAA